MQRDYDFFIVPTPIGNIEDMTLRAVEVLKSVDIIACEDSRVTQKLLYRYDIKTKLVSYHKYNEKQKVEYFLSLLKEGKKIALVSDAGTPMICDPGNILLEELRKNDFRITSLAGASALTTFLSQIPRDGEDFIFVGFLPKKENQLREIVNKYSQTNIVFYESPNRLLKTLEIIKKIDAAAKIAIGRELTKMFEEIIIDNVSNVIDHFSSNILKGEIVAMIYKKEVNDLCQSDLLEKISLLKSKNFSAKDISSIISTLYGANKNEIYKLCM